MPSIAPEVICLTPIFHPNFDPHPSGYGKVCVSLLDEWRCDNDLEDVVQALLFLLYNPNLGFPGTLLMVMTEIDQEEFQTHARAIYSEGKNPFYSNDDEELQGKYNFGRQRLEEEGFLEALRPDLTTEKWRENVNDANTRWNGILTDEKFERNLEKLEEEERRRIEEQRRRDEERRLCEEKEKRRRDSWIPMFMFRISDYVKSLYSRNT